MAVLFDLICSFVSLTVIFMKSCRVSANSRCCIAVLAAAGWTGDALRVPDTATDLNVYRVKLCAGTGTSAMCWKQEKACCGERFMG